ncbi:hypothetical protein [Phyllobacterium sp. K27]
MSKINIGGCDSGALCNESGDAAPKGAADWLSLAAAPVFVIMTLLTATEHGSMADIVCSAGHGSPLSGMTLMYALMSVFHAAPWVRRVSRHWG